MIRTLLKPLSFVPALLLMYMIFSFSAQPGDVSSQVSYKVSYKMVETADYVFDANLEEWQVSEWATKIDFITRKLAHMTEYFALAIAVSFPLYVYGMHGILLMLVAGLICVGFACGDEYHQSFVMGRGPSAKDVCIDSVGIFFGIILVRIIGWTGRKTIFKPKKSFQRKQSHYDDYDYDDRYDRESLQKPEQRIHKKYRRSSYAQDDFQEPPYYGRNDAPEHGYYDRNGYQEPPYYRRKDDPGHGYYDRDGYQELPYYGRNDAPGPGYYDRDGYQEPPYYRRKDDPEPGYYDRDGYQEPPYYRRKDDPEPGYYDRDGYQKPESYDRNDPQKPAKHERDAYRQGSSGAGKKKVKKEKDWFFDM